MEKLKVTKDWATKPRRSACPRSVRRFFQRWPNGLTLSRRNLYMTAKELPVSDIVWLAWQTIMAQPGRTYTDYREVYDLAVATPTAGEYVRSLAKKRAVAKALADKLGL